MLSLSARLKLNLESLNGVETIGNFARHRTAPIVVQDVQTSMFQVRYVPVVSGESLGHGYQTHLVDVCRELGLQVGHYSSLYEFIKFSEKNYLKEEGLAEPKDHNDLQRFEVDVLLKDVVADVGGFLYAGDNSVKRTSRIQMGYMIPALKDTDAAALEAQFHVRYLQSQPQKGGQKRGEGEEQTKLGQAIYNVEVASAIYTLTVNLDLEGISVPSIRFGNRPEPTKLLELEEQKHKRERAAVLALGRLFSSMKTGAKLSRFLPNAEPLSLVVTETSFPFTVSPGNSKEYINTTIQRVDKASEMHRKAGITQVDRAVHVVDNEGALSKNRPQNDYIRVHSNLEELFTHLIETISE